MLGFFLNAISIVSFLTVKEMRNPSNFFVFNLAVADISLNINGLTAAYASYIRYQTEEFLKWICFFHRHFFYIMVGALHATKKAVVFNISQWVKAK